MRKMMAGLMGLAVVLTIMFGVQHETQNAETAPPLPEVVVI